MNPSYPQRSLNNLDLPRDLVKLLESIKNKPVTVAMSGGVDSSVTALLLKLAGAKVCGITMKTYNDSKCCSIEDVKDALRIADKLNIPITVKCVREEFEKAVVNYFIESSLRGETPNPCVLCNKKIKFGVLMNYALAMNNNGFYATGHYVRKQRCNKTFMLLRAVDKNKDQSYALSMLTQDVLEKVIFPLGYLTKSKVREIAKEYNLPVHSKHETQDLCFIHGSKRDFLKNIAPERFVEGNIYNTNEEVIAKHKGIPGYSIGQRRGLGINKERSYYVKAINTKENRLTVGTREELFQDSFYVKDANWIGMKYLKEGLKENLEGIVLDTDVIIRNRMAPQPCTIRLESDNLVRVSMKKRIWAVAPGQLAVFYKDDTIIGSGWII